MINNTKQKKILKNSSLNQESEKKSLYSLFINNWKKIILLIFSSFLFAFGTVIFLFQANTIPSGISSITQTLSYFFIQLKPYITLIYFALNIPLIIIFWNKVKKSFIFLSLIFMLFNSMWGYILGEYSESINSLFVIVKGWDINDINQEGYTTWPIFVYTSLAIFINSLASSLAWKCGASTGGTDIIVYYFSTKKKKSIGNFSWIVASIFTLISIIALFFGGKYESFFGIQTICSFFYIFMNAFLINLIYPKYKKIVVKINSTKHKEIINYFHDSKYWHGFKISTSISGYNGTENTTIETVMLLLEYKEIRNKLIEIDPDIWITHSIVNGVHGKFNYSKLD